MPALWHRLQGQAATTRERFLKQLGDPYRAIGVDENGRTAIDFGVYGVPETYVIDKEGRIRKRYVGPLSERQVAQELLPLVQQLAAFVKAILALLALLLLAPRCRPCGRAERAAERSGARSTRTRAQRGAALPRLPERDDRRIRGAARA